MWGEASMEIHAKQYIRHVSVNVWTAESIA